MFLQIHRQNTICLLNLLIPSLLYRAKSFTTQPDTSKRASQQRMLKNDSKRMVDQVLALTANRPTLYDSKKKQINEALVDVQRALEYRDAVAALKCWQFLESLRDSFSEGSPYPIPVSYYKELARLLCFHLHKMIPPEELDSEVETLAEKFAFKIATQYSNSEALGAYLLFHINRNRPQVVIDHYRTFVKSVGPTISQPPKSISSDSEKWLDLYDDLNSELKLEDLGRISVLLAATTAHIMTGSFKDAFDMYRATDIRIDNPPKIKNKFLQRLENFNPTLHATAQKNLERLETADLVARPRALCNRIMHHSHPSTLYPLQKLYAKLMDGIRDHYLAAQPSEVSGTRLAALTPDVWSSFQTAFIKCERMDLAAKVWSDLLELGIRPGVTMWAALLDTYADLRDPSRVKDTWRMMQREGIQPDVLSYRALISTLFDERRPEEAMRKFGEFQSRFKDHSEPSITIYNTVIRGLLSSNRIDQVNGLFAKMRLTGPAPNIVSYNTLLAYYGRLNDFKALANVVTTMSAANISGDVVTFSTILTALLRVGKEDAPTTILNLMRKQGIQPNVQTYSSIIDHQMRAQTEESLQAALLMLDKMEKDAGIKPNVVTYTSFLSGLYRGNWLSHQKAEEVRTSILARMKKSQINMTLPTYHILIKASLESSHPSGYMDALAYFHEIEDQGIPRVQTTWYLLLTGLIGLRKWDVASRMVSKMLKSGHEPSKGIRTLMSVIDSHQVSR